MTVVLAAQLDLKVEETGGEGETGSGGAGGTRDSGKKRAGRPHRAWSATISEASTPPLVQHSCMFSDIHC